MSIATELQRITQAKANIKAAIESKEVVIEENATIDTYAGKVNEVYSAGYEKGKSEGGTDSRYDTFRDNYQQGGERTDYSYAYYGSGWNDTTFDPMYDITPTNATYIFGSSLITDLQARLDELGRKIDFSECQNLQWLIYGSTITRIGVVDMTNVSSAKNADNVFRGSGGTRLETIEEIILSPTYPLGSASFTNATALKYINSIQGVITGSINLIHSPLVAQSAKNVILALANYAETENEYTKSIKFASAVWEALDAEGNTAPHGGTWVDYVDNVIRWTR